jgi:hypothetical protein
MALIAFIGSVCFIVLLVIGIARTAYHVVQIKTGREKPEE